MSSFLEELRRRNVVRVAVAYAIVGWLLIEVAATILPIFEAPGWITQVFTFFVILGFPLALVLSWAYDLTPEGIERTGPTSASESAAPASGARFNYAIISLLIVAIAFMFVDNYVLNAPRPPFAGAEVDPASLGSAQDAPPVPTAIAPAPTAAEDISVAVLPFASMSDDPEQEYFSDGISEELLNLLAHIPDLRVPSRTSSFSFKGQNTDLPTIAEALNVSHVLEGSVRRAGNEIRITAQLIEVATDSHLWSETYTRELTNVFTIQDEIAANVVEALRIELLSEEVIVQDGYRTDNPAAHDAYLLGRHRLPSRDIEEMLEAREFFQTAIDLDPAYAAPYAGLADANHLLHFYGAIDFDEAMANATSAIERALELDAELGEAYAARGFVSVFFEVNAEAADSDFLRAIELSPNYSEVRHWHGQQVFWLQGRMDDGLDIVRTALDLDPLSPIINAVYGVILHDMGRREEARAAYTRSLDILPGFSLAHSFLGRADSARGQLDEALRRFATAATLDPRGPNHPVVAGMAYVVLGDLDRAQALFDRAASLTGHRSTAEFYEEFTSLVLNREDPDRLIVVIEAIPSVAVRWGTNSEAFFRSAVLQIGDLAALRRYLQRHFPDLVATYETAVHSANYPVAVDLAWLLRMEGDGERAERLLDTSLTELRQKPPNANSFYEGHRGLTEAKILALQGDEDGALAALRSAVDAGWRNLWWMAETDPTLATISGQPEFVAIFDEIRADMAAQLERVREMERAGEIPPWPVTQ